MSDRDRYLEDVLPGESWTSATFVVDRSAAEAFARRYDPQPADLDGLGGGVSGWFVCALVMRDFATARPFGATTIFGMGIDELRWRAPVRPGDALSVRRTVVATRRLRSRPDRGLVRMEVRVSDQDGVEVLGFYETIGIPVRPDGAPQVPVA